MRGGTNQKERVVPWRRSGNEPRSTGSRRRGWDLNPRSLAGHTISNRADSAALALLRAGNAPRGARAAPTGYSAAPQTSARRGPLSCPSPRRLVRWLGPAQRAPVNRVRVGRQQLSAGQFCVPQPTWPSHQTSGPVAGRRLVGSSDSVRHTSRALFRPDFERPVRGRRPVPVALPALPSRPVRAGPGPGPCGAGPPQRRPR